MKRISFLLLVYTLMNAEVAVIPAARTAATDALNPASSAWKSASLVQLALHRTPPLYATDAPAVLEIPVVQIQGLHVAGKTILRLEWKDPSGDAATLAEAKTVWQTEGNAVHSEATDRFFDACAVMLPTQPVTDGAFPSLQMGDASHPVLIYYYSAARGAAVMDASGRGTTRRTGEAFPARATYVAGAWQVTMELPEIPAETPLSVAVWNGSQQDRDGRKYFSVWHKIR